jgi:DNA-binding transcriptional MerR regulator
MEIQSDSSQRPRATMHIGELSRRSGHSVHAIRWYESIGLVPGVVRDAGKRRVYGERHVGWFYLIDRLRLTGMSTKQIRAYADLTARGRPTLQARRDLLAAHREHVMAMIGEWRLALSLIDRKIEFYADWINTGCRPPEPSVPGGASARRRGRGAIKRLAPDLPQEDTSSY